MQADLLNIFEDYLRKRHRRYLFELHEFSNYRSFDFFALFLSEGWEKLEKIKESHILPLSTGYFLSNNINYFRLTHVISLIRLFLRHSVIPKQA